MRVTWESLEAKASCFGWNFLCLIDSCARATDVVTQSRGSGWRWAVCRDALWISLHTVQHVWEPCHLEEDPSTRGNVHQHHGKHSRSVPGHTTLRGRPRLRSSALSNAAQDYKCVSLLTCRRNYSQSDHLPNKKPAYKILIHFFKFKIKTMV